MSGNRRCSERLLASLAVTLVLLAVPAMAQVTSGSLAGVVTDESGAMVPGVDVSATHQPTGTTYHAVTAADGHFSIQSVRVGGPYVVTAALSGFRTAEKKDLHVRLGEVREIQFKMVVLSVTESVTVTAEANAIFNPSNTGPTSNVGQESLDKLPSIGRSMEDFARLNPYFASAAIGGTLTNAVSVAGRNNRYNNIQIDGAVNNDLFGLASSGSPGGQADTAPVSLDAIEEIQLLVAPYDVRHGGFSGGGMNAITKGGTNTITGTAYTFFRNQAFVGDGPNDKPYSDFSDKQFGVSLGGPIQKDKAFFFVNAEFGRRTTPNGWTAGGASVQNFGHVTETKAFREILQNQYGYDPGDPSEEFDKKTENNKVFGRLDFNLSPKHRLTLRHNFIDGTNNLYGSGNGSTYFNFPDHPYTFDSTTNSTVAQLHSNVGPGLNELRVTYQRIREKRSYAGAFPQVTVRLADGAQMVAGAEQYSAANGLDQDILEITDDYTFTRGKHTITVGTHNEIFEFGNLYIRDNFGTYQFNGLDNLRKGIAQSYDYSFSTTSDPQQRAKFKVYQLGFYAGDLWRVAPRVTLTLGLRLDKPIFPDKPTDNPAAQSNFGFSTSVAPATTMISPRVGFNWDVMGDGKRQIRGGGGLFSGRTPYVWLSKQYGNTGIEFQRIGASYNTANTIPFVADPAAQPKSVTGAKGTAYTNEIDVVDPDYSFPKVIRGNLAYDHDLGVFGLVGTVEFLGSTTLKDIDYRNLNRVPGTTTLFDGRPIFTRKVSSLSDVILLTNTDEGSQWSIATKLERPFRDGLYASASYLYGRSKSVNDGTSSQAVSNWRYVYVPGDINNPPVAYSNFSVGSRINLAVSYELKVLSYLHPVVSLFYNGQSGRPYSVLFNTDVNGDGTTGNDLIYVPKDPSEVTVTNGTWDDLNAWIQDDEGLSENRGKIVGRNVSRAPWTNSLDFRLAFAIPFKGDRRKVELTMDVFNLLNLLDSDKGVFKYVGNQSMAPIQYGGIDKTTQKPIYNIATLNLATYQKFTTDDLRSRWNAQFGARIRF